MKLISLTNYYNIKNCNLIGLNFIFNFLAPRFKIYNLCLENYQYRLHLGNLSRN